ncbi:biosynthetic peptidoglycan transglycosylase [Erysipelothrix tonsillarum]|uniref:biosynthetic peptidoglycan transglycosylase n=1 Tax=Erysipelothrix tonsillarum TaxID=38402 RepID=UPI0003700A15|nr:biosynthetic peptidoglycan transglycosylase [Erysipelothrix tonsillarum]
MKKLIRKLILMILTVALVISGVIIFFGYQEYQSVIAKKPVDEVLMVLQQDEAYTKIDEIPNIAIKAMVATEDTRLFTRKSVMDPRAILRAIVHNLKQRKLVEGGSTIPQQVSKNLYFDHSASFVRKVSEYFVTRDLLLNYTKEEILEMYLNMIYYGDGNYGIYHASVGYFDVLPSELNDGQATLLMGLPQSPSYYALSSNFEAAKARQRHVLNRLVDIGEISEGRADEIYLIDVYGGQ